MEICKWNSDRENEVFSSLGKTKIPGLVNSWALARKGLQGRIKESDYTQSSRKKVTEIINHEMVQEEINSKCFYILID